MKCPDDGACHHDCETSCWRVWFCAPLSAYGDDWTTADQLANAEPPAPRIESLIVAPDPDT